MIVPSCRHARVDGVEVLRKHTFWQVVVLGLPDVVAVAVREATDCADVVVAGAAEDVDETRVGQVEGNSTGSGIMESQLNEKV